MSNPIVYIGRFWLNPKLAVVSFRLCGIAYKYFMHPADASRVHRLAEDGALGPAVQLSKECYIKYERVTSTRTNILNNQGNIKENSGDTLSLFNRNLPVRTGGSAKDENLGTDEIIQNKNRSKNDRRKIKSN